MQDNNIQICSKHNEGKSIVAERFIRTSRNKIYKFMTSILKNGYIDKLDEIINKYINTYHRTIKTKPVDVNPSMYIDFNKENNKKSPKVKVGDHVRTWKYKNIFAKGYVPNWSEKTFVIEKVKNTLAWANAISDLNGEEIVITFYKKQLQKTNQKEFRVENVIKRKGIYMLNGKVMIILNSWIDRKDIA